MMRLVLLLLFCPLLVVGQQTSGVIKYTETVKFDIDFGDDERAAQIKQMLGESQSWERSLFFNAEESIYRYDKSEDGEKEFESQGGGFRMKMMMAKQDEETYHNIAENRMTEYKDFMSKKFLIKGPPEEKAWKITGKGKEILGYNCMEAIYIAPKDTTIPDSSPFAAYRDDTTRAWFATGIPVATGPRGTTGLPGMVLELHQRGGKFIVTAAKVDLRELEEGELVEPTKGKEMTTEEFEEMQQKKIEEMREQFGGERGGRMMWMAK